MNKTTHLIGGICASSVAVAIIGKPEAVIPIVSTAVIGSLFPDIDEPNSSMGHKHPIVSAIAKTTLGHRGAIHTPFVMLIIVNVMLFLVKGLWGESNIGYCLVLGFATGYLSHLLLDLITPKGIMLLYPLSKKYIRLIGFKSKTRDICTSLVLIIITCAITIKFIL